jgi:hypothetical protein
MTYGLGQQDVGIRTVVYRQQPIGMARTANPNDAIELIRDLCDEHEPEDTFQVRRPNPNEAGIFAERIGESRRGSVGFLF